jgi:hypothetical protein
VADSSNFPGGTSMHLDRDYRKPSLRIPSRRVPGGDAPGF